MNGFPGGLGLWVLGGLLWWLASLATAAPYRFRHRAWLTWARRTVGLPLVVAAWLEGALAMPYRGFLPLLGSLVVAEALALAVGLVIAAAA